MTDISNSPRYKELLSRKEDIRGMILRGMTVKQISIETKADYPIVQCMIVKESLRERANKPSPEREIQLWRSAIYGIAL